MIRFDLPKTPLTEALFELGLRVSDVDVNGRLDVVLPPRAFLALIEENIRFRHGRDVTLGANSFMTGGPLAIAHPAGEFRVWRADRIKPGDIP